MPHDDDTPKHVQLGAEPPVDGPDPELLEDPDTLDAMWADACTVEEFRAALLGLGALPDDTVAELRRARHGED